MDPLSRRTLIGTGAAALLLPGASFASVRGAGALAELRASASSLVVQAMAEHSVPGAVLFLMRQGRMVLEQAYGLADRASNRPITATAQFEVASLSKPAFASLVLQLASEGVLDLDQPLADLFDDPAMRGDARYRAITARMVLSHRSGLPNWRAQEPGRQLTYAFDPGQPGFRYSGEGYQYLARVIAHRLRLDALGLDRLFVERVARPAGSRTMRFLPDAAMLAAKARPHDDEGEPMPVVPPDGVFGSAYSLHCTARDYARWLVAIAGRRLLRPASRALLLTAQGVPVPQTSENRAVALVDWSLGFGVHDLPGGRVVAHSGNNEGWTALALLDPDTRDALVLLTNRNQANMFIANTGLGLWSMLRA